MTATFQEELRNPKLRRCMRCGSGVEPALRIHLSRAGYPYCEAHLDNMPSYGAMLGKETRPHDCYQCESESG